MNNGEILRIIFYLSVFLVQGALFKGIIEYKKDTIEFSSRYLTSVIMHSMIVTCSVGWIILTLVPIRKEFPLLFYMCYILINILGVLVLSIIFNKFISKNKTALQIFDKIVLTKDIISEEIHISGNYTKVEFHLIDDSIIRCTFNDRLFSDLKNNSKYIEGEPYPSTNCKENIIINKETIEYMVLMK